MSESVSPEWIKGREIILLEASPIDCLLDNAEQIRLGKNPNKPNDGPLVTSGRIMCRGEPRLYDSYLTPKIFREDHSRYEESELIAEFERCYPAYRDKCVSKAEWLSVMQHHGVPTRLLDWSRNPLVALYFAVSEKNSKEEDGAVFIYPICDRIGHMGSPLQTIPIILAGFDQVHLYAEMGLMKTSKELCNLLCENFGPDSFGLDGYTIVQKSKHPIGRLTEYFAPHSHPRLGLQQGVFTIHFGKYINNNKVLDFDVKEDPSGVRSSIYRVVIPANLKKTLLRKLDLLGINELTLFPGEDNFYSDFQLKKSLL